MHDELSQLLLHRLVYIPFLTNARLVRIRHLTSKPPHFPIISCLPTALVPRRHLRVIILQRRSIRIDGTLLGVHLCDCGVEHNFFRVTRHFSKLLLASAPLVLLDLLSFLGGRAGRLLGGKDWVFTFAKSVLLLSRLNHECLRVGALVPKELR